MRLCSLLVGVLRDLSAWLPVSHPVLQLTALSAACAEPRSRQCSAQCGHAGPLWDSRCWAARQLAQSEYVGAAWASQSAPGEDGPMLAGSRLAELGSPAVVILGCTNPKIVDAWCSQYPVTCLQAKKREGELATRVSAMEAEMQSAQAVAAPVHSRGGRPAQPAHGAS